MKTADRSAFIMRIECKDVEYVLAIAKHQSLTMAAEELYITQPALSKYVKTIEERIGAPLFVHGKRPLQLTKEGELFVTYAKEVSTAIASLETEMDRLMRKDYEIVRVGYASNGLREHIYHAVQNIYQKEPGVRFELQEMTSQQIEAMLLTGHLDMGFATLPMANNRDITSQFVMEEEILLAVPSTHPFASLGTRCSSPDFPVINLSLFKNDTFVLRNIDTRFAAASNLLFEEANFTPNIATRARSNFSCLEFAEEWKVCALTTKTFTRYLHDPESMRFFVAGPEPKKLNSGFVYPKRKSPSFYGFQLAEEVCDLVAKGNDIAKIKIKRQE